MVEITLNKGDNMLKIGKFTVDNFEFVEPDLLLFDIDPEPTKEEEKEIEEIVINALIVGLDVELNNDKTKV